MFKGKVKVWIFHGQLNLKSDFLNRTILHAHVANWKGISTIFLMHPFCSVLVKNKYRYGLCLVHILKRFNLLPSWNYWGSWSPCCSDWGPVRMYYSLCTAWLKMRLLYGLDMSLRPGDVPVAWTSVWDTNIQLENFYINWYIITL